MEAFSELRDECPVLAKLIVPGTDWPRFRQWHQDSLPRAAHMSTALLALKRGYLDVYTFPLHQFLIDGSDIAPGVSNKYLGDLRERWMFAPGPLSRHQHWRRHQAILSELHIAQTLVERYQWIVTDLEAYGADHDIVAEDPKSRPVAVEIKFIGPDDDDFQMVWASMEDRQYRSNANWYSGMNYLLVRLFEAAQQLRDVEKRRIAIVVYDDIAWDHIKMPLQWRWIDFREAAFSELGDARWLAFLNDKLLTRYPSLVQDLSAAIRTLDAVMIFRQRPNYDYDLELEHDGGTS